MAAIAAASFVIAAFIGGQALGFVASVVSFVLFVPQAAKAWRMRRDWSALRGVSLEMQFFLLANAALWAVYAPGDRRLLDRRPGYRQRSPGSDDHRARPPFTPLPG